MLIQLLRDKLLPASMFRPEDLAADYDTKPVAIVGDHGMVLDLGETDMMTNYGRRLIQDGDAVEVAYEDEPATNQTTPAELKPFDPFQDPEPYVPMPANRKEALRAVSV